MIGRGTACRALRQIAVYILSGATVDLPDHAIFFHYPETRNPTLTPDSRNLSSGRWHWIV